MSFGGFGLKRFAARTRSHLSVDSRILRYDNRSVTSREFIRRAKDYARRTGKSFRFDPTHGTVYVGARFTTVQRGEVKKGVLAAMLRQLEIGRGEF